MNEKILIIKKKKTTYRGIVRVKNANRDNEAHRDIAQWGAVNTLEEKRKQGGNPDTGAGLRKRSGLAKSL